MSRSRGITEAQDEKGQEFGRSRLEELVALHANDRSQEVLDAISAAVTKHSRGMEAFDDQSLFVGTQASLKFGDTPSKMPLQLADFFRWAAGAIAHVFSLT